MDLVDIFAAIPSGRTRNANRKLDAIFERINVHAILDIRAERPFMNLSSFSFLANEDALVDVGSILQFHSSKTFRYWILRPHSLPGTAAILPLCNLELVHPSMDGVEVISLLRCCKSLHLFELQPLLEMTRGGSMVLLRVSGAASHRMTRLLPEDSIGIGNHCFDRILLDTHN